MRPSYLNTGGPAFPHGEALNFETHKIVSPSTGMTLRDYFAAKAMQGFCASADHLDRIGSFKGAALTAYAVADAMLAAREGA